MEPIGGKLKQRNMGRYGKNPDYTTVVDLARRYTTDAITALLEIVRSSRSDLARIRAAEIIIDRGWGKSREMIEVRTSHGGDLREWGTDELQRYLMLAVKMRDEKNNETVDH